MERIEYEYVHVNTPLQGERLVAMPKLKPFGTKVWVQGILIGELGDNKLVVNFPGMGSFAFETTEVKEAYE